MKRKILALAGALVGITLGLGLAAHPAHASEAPACSMPTGWSVNDDETARTPTPETGGLKFEGDQLIHHAAPTGLTVEDLTPGAYLAVPAPDQPSFFSVEVYGTDGGYATLRWDAVLSDWTMVTGGQLYTNASPAALVDMPASHKSHHVVRFGVGYTANPPGTVAAVVSSVTFQKTTYDLTCKTASPSPSVTSKSPPTTPSHSATATHRPTTSASSAAGALAITGPNIPVIVGVGVALGLFGFTVLMAVARRRRTYFRP